MLFEEALELALYDEEHGFYATQGRAGRRGDFLTSPEVGPLFGHLVSRTLDAEWERLGRPDNFTVVEFGAGPGTLARAVFAAEPACIDAMTYIAVERSEVQRSDHPDGVQSVAALTPDMIGSGFHGVVFANELLDNLAFCPITWENGEPLFTHVDVDEDDRLVATMQRSASRAVSGLIPDRSVVDQSAAADWVNWMLNDVLAAGRLIVVDYARRDTAEVTLRTYSEHGPAGDPLAQLGTKDITVDVDLEVLQRRTRPCDRITTQAAWLEGLGIDGLVAEGKATWERLAGTGGLEALRGLSRVREAEALCESDGLGGFFVAEWDVS